MASSARVDESSHRRIIERTRGTQEIGSLIPVTVHDRRKRFRFQINTEIRYQSICQGQGSGEAVSGTGRVENISSKSLAFLADRPIEKGLRLKASMAWPAMLDDQCMLRLAFEGVVVRTRGNLVVVTIERPEMRTAGKLVSGVTRQMGGVAGMGGAPAAS